MKIDLLEPIVKTVMFFILIVAQDLTVFYIFPAEVYKEVYLAYGFLGSMLYTGLSFYWEFENPLKKEYDLKNKVIRLSLRTILGTITTFILLGVWKAFFENTTEFKMLGIGIGLGFFFEFYGKKSFINNIFKSIGERILKTINPPSND